MSEKKYSRNCSSQIRAKSNVFLKITKILSLHFLTYFVKMSKMSTFCNLLFPSYKLKISEHDWKKVFIWISHLRLKLKPRIFENLQTCHFFTFWHYFVKMGKMCAFHPHPFFFTSSRSQNVTEKKHSSEFFIPDWFSRQDFFEIYRDLTFELFDLYRENEQDVNNSLLSYSAYKFKILETRLKNVFLWVSQFQIVAQAIVSLKLFRDLIFALFDMFRKKQRDVNISHCRVSCLQVQDLEIWLKKKYFSEFFISDYSSTQCFSQNHKDLIFALFDIFRENEQDVNISPSRFILTSSISGKKTEKSISLNCSSQTEAQAKDFLEFTGISFLHLLTCFVKMGKTG